MNAADLRQKAEEMVRLHLRVVSDWTARPRELPVEPHLLDELAADVVRDVLMVLGALPTIADDDSFRDCHAAVPRSDEVELIPMGRRR